MSSTAMHGTTRDRGLAPVARRLAARGERIVSAVRRRGGVEGDRVDLRNTWQVVAGSLLVPLGIVFILMSWYGAAHTPYVQQQIPYLVSGSFAGLGCIVLGGLLYWAHWLYRLYDQADMHHEEQIEALHQTLLAMAERFGPPSEGTPGEAIAAHPGVPNGAVAVGVGAARGGEGPGRRRGDGPSAPRRPGLVRPSRPGGRGGRVRPHRGRHRLPPARLSGGGPPSPGGPPAGGRRPGRGEALPHLPPRLRGRPARSGPPASRCRTATRPPLTPPSGLTFASGNANVVPIGDRSGVPKSLVTRQNAGERHGRLGPGKG